MKGKRVRLRASHVVGFRAGGHVLWRDGEAVFRDGVIEFVGRGFPGPVDEDIDYGTALVGPGFIDLDALGDLDSTVLCFDNETDWKLGRVWTADYVKAGPHEANTPQEEQFKYRYAFTQLIRNGITTAMPITSMAYRKWAESYDEFAGVAATAKDLGIRAYLGPCYMSGVTLTDDQGRTSQHWDEAKGLAGLAEADRYIRDFDGKGGGLIRAFLAPDRIETCTPALLARTAEIVKETGVPFRLHSCQSRYEVELVKRLRGCSPYRWLSDLGLLGPKAILPHGIYLEPGDMDLLAASGASIVHCPVVWARDGEALHSFAGYKSRGINIAMGTDTFPSDMVDNLRQGINICRVVDRKRDAGSAAEFYTAATLGGAKALGRDDLGKLAPGAQADITVFDLTGLHLGPLIDPVKTMVLAGTGRDFTHAWIAGRPVMTERRIAGIEDEVLRRQAERMFRKLEASHVARAPGHPPVTELFKASFPDAEA